MELNLNKDYTMEKHFDKIFEHLISIGYEENGVDFVEKELTDKFLSYVKIDWGNKELICRSMAHTPKVSVYSDQIRTFKQLELVAIEDIARYVEIMIIQATSKVAEELVLKDYAHPNNRQVSTNKF